MHDTLRTSEIQDEIAECPFQWTLVEDIMWTSTLELDLAHVIPTRILGRFWHGAYFSSIAPFQVQNLPRQPLPAGNWVRVRNVLAGISGSDLDLIFVDRDFSLAPLAFSGHGRSYPGHEVVGEVIEVGDEVSSVRVGERVVLKNGPNCVTAGLSPLCRSCAVGNYILCERGNLPGPQPFGGGWSEEMLLHEQQLFRVPTAITDIQAVLLEPSAIAVHAVLRHLPLAGSRVLIIGAGTIGLLMLQVLRTLAPDVEVSVLARHAFQVEQAARLGAQIIYPQDSYKEVQRITGGQLYRGPFGNHMLLGGYDAIYDTVASKRTLHDSLRWTRAGGTIVMVGLNQHRMLIDLTPIWYQEINLLGSMGPGIETWPLDTTEQASTFEVAAALIQQQRIHPEKLLTHSFALSDYRNALLTATHKAQNRAIKVVFDYAKQPPSVVPNVRAAARRQRTFTPVQYNDPRPSQPLLPESETMPPPQVFPVPQLPVLPPTPTPVTYDPSEEDWQDEKTVVVSKPRFAHYQTPTPTPTSAAAPMPNAGNQLGEPLHVDDQNDQDNDMLVGATEKFARITLTPLPTPPPPLTSTPLTTEEEEGSRAENVTSIATSPADDEDSELDLPLDADAFSTDIPGTFTPSTYEDSTGISETLGASEAPEDLEIAEIAKITETSDTSDTSDTLDTSDTSAVSEAWEAWETSETPEDEKLEAPLTAPHNNAENDEGMFFSLPPLTFTDSPEEGQSEVPPWLAALDAKPQFLAPLEEVEGTGASPDLNPLSSQQNAAVNKAGVASGSKRPRSRRKTGGWVAKNTPVLEAEQQPDVTNTAPGALERVGEHVTSDSDPASTQTQNDHTVDEL